MKIYDESAYCVECGEEISTSEHLFNNGHCNECREIVDKLVKQKKRNAKKKAKD